MSAPPDAQQDERPGCEHCWPEAPEAADEASRGLQPVARLVDESHYIVRTSVCPACGQHYLHVFTETIDWSDGDDPCVRSRMPVSVEELTALGAAPSETDLTNLAPGRRYLLQDSPQGAPAAVSWRTGLRVGRHD